MSQATMSDVTDISPDPEQSPRTPQGIETNNSSASSGGNGDSFNLLGLSRELRDMIYLEAAHGWGENLTDTHTLIHPKSYDDEESQPFTVVKSFNEREMDLYSKQTRVGDVSAVFSCVQQTPALLKVNKQITTEVKELLRKQPYTWIIVYSPIPEYARRVRESGITVWFVDDCENIKLPFLTIEVTALRPVESEVIGQPHRELRRFAIHREDYLELGQVISMTEGYLLVNVEIPKVAEARCQGSEVIARDPDHSVVTQLANAISDFSLWFNINGWYSNDEEDLQDEVLDAIWDVYNNANLEEATIGSLDTLIDYATNDQREFSEDPSEIKIQVRNSRKWLSLINNLYRSFDKERLWHARVHDPSLNIPKFFHALMDAATILYKGEKMLGNVEEANRWREYALFTLPEEELFRLSDLMAGGWIEQPVGFRRATAYFMLEEYDCAAHVFNCAIEYYGNPTELLAWSGSSLSPAHMTWLRDGIERHLQVMFPNAANVWKEASISSARQRRIDFDDGTDIIEYEVTPLSKSKHREVKEHVLNPFDWDSWNDWLDWDVWNGRHPDQAAHATP